ncbi:hypothetical protein [Tissierella praeacuta]|uniref:hypothetical protein n=1 Tax=Tissierella praeacuta TaxID=43131 RepID=UPI00334136C1
MDKYKIGQEIVITDNFEIESWLSKKKVEVKKDDRGIIDSKGFVHYTTGQARGMVQKLDWENLKIEGYDYRNIAKMVYDKLNWDFNLYDDFLDDYELEKEDFINAIEGILRNIL